MNAPAAAALAPASLSLWMQRYGRNAISYQGMASHLRTRWLNGASPAAIRYVDTGAAWVSAGMPLAPSADLREAVQTFFAEARAHRRRGCIFGVESSALPQDAHALRIGEQGWWTRDGWLQRLQTKPSLREQLRRTRAADVRIVQASPNELQPEHPLGRQIVPLFEDWLSRHAMAPMDFVARVLPFSVLPGQQHWMALRRQRVVGLLTLNPVPTRQAGMVHHLVRASNAANGVTESLFDAAVRDSRRPITLGLVPLAGPVATPLQVARRLGSGLYNFAGLQTFKSKLGAQKTEDVHVVYPGGTPVAATRAVLDVLDAFAGGSFSAFAQATARRAI